MLTAPEEDIDRITEVFHHLLNGQVPASIELPREYPDNEIKQLVHYVNTFLAQYEAFSQCMRSVSAGDLEFTAPRGKMHTLQSLKNLQANLRHLTWKTQQVAKGDFSQRVDFMGDFSEAFNGMARQLKAAFETIEQQNRELTEANRIIREEKERSERLLLNVLPARVAEELKRTGKTTPELFENVTVLFSDLVNFTAVSAALTPETLIGELNALFTQFDRIITENGCERIKTIGDAYLAVCGMPAPNPGHAGNILRAALHMMRWLEERNTASPLKWRLRIGVHSGPVMGAVVGIQKYIYDVFGDTINTASRMESHSEPMKINVSETTRRLGGDAFTFLERPPVEVKGKGSQNMYFVESIQTGLHHPYRPG